MPTTTIAETATKIDAPLIISLAALALAILSPLITAWVQGKYRLKEIKQEAQRDAQRHEQQYYTEHRTAVIENYIRAGMRLSVTESTADIAAFEVASGENIPLPRKRVLGAAWPCRRNRGNRPIH